MKPHRLVALIACVVATLATGAAAPSATVDSCRPTDVVFYTTDTVRLASELSEFGSPCADYYLSVTPNATGGPRGGAPITTIRSLGPRFHALTEVRLPVWASYAATHGWYAAGVEVRRLMAAAGYNTALGDSWAINEVGAPTTAQMGIDVLRNTGTARQDLRDFVRGLHTGSGAPSAGLVFAADPLQVTTDLAQYKQELLSWYGDAPFWEDLSRYVRFWAQETYADARSWGVEGSTLAERTRIPERLLRARQSARGRGRLRHRDRRRFLRPRLRPARERGVPLGAAEPRDRDRLRLHRDRARDDAELRLRADLRAARLRPRSPRLRVRAAERPRRGDARGRRPARGLRAGVAVDPAGACGADGASCDGVVAGAQFNDAWKTFTDVTPPTIVPHVAGPLGNAGWYTGDATVTWEAQTRSPPSSPRRAAASRWSPPTPTASRSPARRRATAAAAPRPSRSSATRRRRTSPASRAGR